MAQEDQLSRWVSIAKIAVPIIALVTFVLGGGFFYREIWYIPDLRYTLLPTYDVEEMALSGIVVENRGRVPVRDLDIILSDLEHDIQRLHMPGPHERADTSWDPKNPSNEATIKMERLSPGASLSIYLLTSAPVTLAEERTFFISSHRGKARPSPEAGLREFILGPIFNLTLVVAAGITCYLAYRLVQRSEGLAQGSKALLEQAQALISAVEDAIEEPKAVSNDERNTMCGAGQGGSDSQEVGEDRDLISGDNWRAT